jgi:hypothetical protein
MLHNFERTATTLFAATIGCALRSTNGDREKSGAKNNPNINEQINARRSALSGTGLPRVICANTGRAESEAERGALPQKAREFHARIAAARKLPGNCGRCGKPNANGHRQCDRCRAYSKKYKLAQSQEPVTVDVKALRHLTARVASLELSVARLQLDARTAYKRGYRTGQRIEQKRRDCYEPPNITKAELSTMNHAYGTNK